MTGQKEKNWLIWFKLSTRGFFWFVDYETELEIHKYKTADPMWRTWKQHVDLFGSNSVLGDFLGFWLSIWTENSGIQNGIQYGGPKSKKLIDYVQTWY